MEDTPVSTKVPSRAPSTTSEKDRTNGHSSDPAALEKVDTSADDAAADAAPVEQTITSQRRAAEAAADYPSGPKLAIIMVGLELAVLCVALDNTIIATAIPKITDEFHALSDVGWYGSAYLLTISSFQLFFGRLYSMFSIKWMFLLTLFIFELGSLICAVAPNSTALIVGRAIAGMGSAGLFSGALIILAVTTPLDKRPLYTSLITAVYGIASIVGPLLGGVFTDRVTWRWCFYINLPLGGVTAAALIFFLHTPKQERQTTLTWRQNIARFDPIGTILFLPCIVCVLLALQWGGTTYPWSDGRIIALFVVFGVLAIAFVAVQAWMGENATTPPRILKKRSVAFGCLFSISVGGSFFVFVYYIPIWFQAIRGVSAVQSGIDTLPLMIAAVVASIFAGTIVSIFGYYTPFMYGMVIIGSIGAGLMTTWTVDISTGKWIGYQILYGFGLGLGMQQALVATQTVLATTDVAIGTAVVIFSQMFGGSLFVSVAQNTFTNHLASGLQGIPGVSDPRIVINTGATQLVNLFKDPAVLRQVQIVYNEALTKAFLVSLVMMCFGAIGAAGMEWKSVKGKKIEPVGA